MIKITGFKTKDFRGSNTSWIYVVVNASLRSYVIHQDQLRIFTPKSQRKKKEENNNIHNVVKQ